MHQEKERPIIIDVHLTRGTVTVLILALVTVCFVAYLGFAGTGISAADGQASAAALAAASPGTRQFYLTHDTHKGAQARNACEPGFHMASMWEVLDPSNLTYNPDLGQTDMDSGEGPPSDVGGWIRTGGSASGGIPGYANCQGYSTSTPGQSGTTVWLDTTWDGTAADFHVWEASTWSCGNSSPVWCVED